MGHGVLLVWRVDVVVDDVGLCAQAAHDEIKHLAQGVWRQKGGVPVMGQPSGRCSGSKRLT